MKLKWFAIDTMFKLTTCRKSTRLPLHCTSSRSLLLICMAACLGGPTAARGDEPDAIRAVANGVTVCIVQLDLGRLTLPDAEPLKPLERLLDEVRQAVGDQTITIAIDLPYRSTGNPVRLTAKTEGIQQERLKQLMQRYAGGLFIEPPITQGEWTVVGIQALAPYETKEDTQVPASVLPVEFERWQQALADPSNSPLQVIVVPPSYLRRAFEELAPELPASLGGGSSLVLTEGVQWLHLSYDPGALTGQLQVQSDSAPAAAALAKHFPHMLRGLIDQWGPKAETSKTVLMALAGLFQPQQQASRLVLPLENTEATQQILSLLKLVAQFGEARITTNRSSDKLKQFALAIHNYESSNKSFPPDAEARGKDGHSG